MNSVSKVSTDLDARLLIEIKDLSHRFGARELFKPVNGRVESGGILVVTGTNGSGKSTFLKLAAGLLTPVSGSVEFYADGLSLDRERRRERIGYVSPDLTLYQELTGAENLNFFAEAKGVDFPRKDLIELLTFVGLKGRGRDLVGNYSSGMKQRLKYAFALLNAPPALFLDEPTANLDEAGMEIVGEIVRRQTMELGGLAIVATNEPREVEWSANRIHLEPIS